MSIQQDEILIKEYKKGTTLSFFSTHLDVMSDSVVDPDSEMNISPAVLWFNNISEPVEITFFDGATVWVLNDLNNSVPFDYAGSNYIIGFCYTQKLRFKASSSELESIKNRFSKGITEKLLFDAMQAFPPDSNVDPNSLILPVHKDYVFFEYNEIEDFYVDLKLKRTFATLDKLNIYNNLINSAPVQSAKTGVVFGKISALQNIKDSKGNRIKIPLRNVPIGIFNSSEDYPTSSSVLDNGDRIFLNIKESASANEYFNVESFNFDRDKLLRSASEFTRVPEQYKYVTTTNDNGEFVIYDVPVGTQVVMFEVDLLKQGLTRDEIALNFYPFPPDEDAMIDQIPNFAFKKFPIDVVPSWGEIQTGYTELNVTVNMDLRKWTTYMFPPVTVGPERLESSVAKDAGNSIKIEVRDMSKQGFPKTDIKLAEVHNDLDRVSGQQYNWHLEMAQIKSRAEYYKFGCPIIKLPANIYDPEGFRTDREGNPTAHKGVWLSAYQLSIFSNSSINRKTGSIYAWNGSDMYTKSHFDLNFSDSVPDSNPAEFGGIGAYPYEFPWTSEYPEKYSIPKKPTKERYRYEQQRTPTSTPGLYFLDEPAYSDGDLIGYQVGNISGGFGSQTSFGEWFGNRISQVATKNFMYKYESGVAWNETYANGYEPSNPGYENFPGVSRVIGGEKFQRFESGYGYFLRPTGWPRIERTMWGSDTYFKPDITHSFGLGGDPENPGPGSTSPTQSGGLKSSKEHYNDVYNLNNIELAFAMNSKSKVKKGTLEAYRIIDSNPDNLNVPGPLVIPTLAKLTCSGWADRLYSFVLQNTGEVEVNFNLTVGGGALGKVNTASGIVANGQVVTLAPGGSYEMKNPIDGGLFSPEAMLQYSVQYLPGNANFNISTNRYDLASYKLTVSLRGETNGDSTKYVQFNRPALTTPGEWFIKTHHAKGGNGAISNGINTRHSSISSEKIWSMEIEDNNLSYDL